MALAQCSPQPSFGLEDKRHDRLIVAERPKLLWSLPFPDDVERHISITAPRRIIIVGDPHGCLDEFEDLLQQAGFDASAGDAVVIVGDLVNKGPKSIEMLRAARDRDGIWSIRGNHEDNALRDWQEWKAGETPKQAWVTGMTEDDVSYLQTLPYTCALPQHDVLVVHAGLVPGKALQNQLDGDMLRMRNLVLIEEEGQAPEWVASERDGVGVAWAGLWLGPPHVIFGHDAIRKLQQYDHATGLDTGCAYGFQLSACILDSSEPGKRHVVQVPARAEYEKPGL
eukprot:TRINITY_DN93494_c0_g1_i1.p1 TRINITY_DN93494_c0_g1~~TRINITY_DN93494_c0_g1_i1.p1  ORF type:complete len:282 (+),score=51.40 TRINITY_DN93494_c0_g1_i1:113-958(+)